MTNPTNPSPNPERSRSKAAAGALASFVFFLCLTIWLAGWLSLRQAAAIFLGFLTVGAALGFLQATNAPRGPKA